MHLDVTGSVTLILFYTEQQSKVHGGHLLNTEVKTRQRIQSTIKCELRECLCLKDITNILKKYKSYIYKSDNEQKEACIDTHVYDRTGNKYNCVDLLNDFNHLLECHFTEFEEIYKILNEQIYDNNGCELSKCLLLRRHHRDRQKISDNDRILNELYNVNDDVVSQQLLDRIHCHYFHSFDTGYKLSEKDKRDIIDEEKKSNDEYHQITSSKILSKSKEYQNMEGLKHLESKKNKFQNLKKYSYGKRFYYWEPYKHCNKRVDPLSSRLNPEVRRRESEPVSFWYIQKRHENIKAELLSNSICCLQFKQWQSLLGKAAALNATHKVSSIYCRNKETAYWYEMKHRDQMNINHVIAAMAYCNFDVCFFHSFL